MKTNKCMKVEQAILAVTGIMFFAVFFLYVVPAYGDMTPEEFNIAMGRDAGAPLPTALPFIRGDVNGDGVVNAADANILAQYLSGNHSLLASYDVGDVNADGTINQADLDYLRAYLAGTGPTPPPPFGTPAVVHPYFCTTPECTAVLESRLVKFVVSNLAAPGSDCALWSAQAYDAATNALLGRYALSAEYGETESSFTISYFRNVDVTRDRTAIPQTEDTFTEQTPYRYDDAGNAFREEIDVNTAITILADLLLTDAGPIDTSEGFGIVSYKPSTQKGYHTLGGGPKKPRAGQPGGGNQTFPRCPNGCSGPVNLPFPNTGAMNYCCDIHDLCYTIGGDRAYKNQCDADLRSCLSQVTPGWSKIVGHLLPPFVTPEIGRWFREHFADKAFRWTNEPQTCFSWVFFLSWCCYDTKPQDVPTMTYGCDNSIYPSNCLFHKAGIPGQTQPDDWWFACINRSYSSWPTSAASNFTPIDSSAAAACSSCGNAVSLTADSSSIKDSGPVPFDNGGQCVASCGNGQIDAAAGEECDSENLAGQTCQSKGFIAGQLGCTSNCSFDTSNCLRASTYEIWKAAKFSPAQQADPAVSGPSADPDNDRVVNILEYLSNSDPLVPTNLGDILQYYFYRNTTDNKDYFTLKVKRNKNATDAVYKPAAENSIMGPWDYAFYGDTYVQNIDGNSEWVFYRDKVSKDSVAMRLFKLDVAKTSTPAMKVGLMTNPNPTRVYYRLTVTKTGQGLVTSASGQINCGEACFAESAQGTSEALTALASSGFKFDGWSGVCSGTGACTVTSDAAQQVGAAFSRIAFCGDGAKNGVEECDGQDLGGYSCLSFGGYVGGELGCTSLCRYDQSRCLMQICGNNAIEGTEQCDGSSLTGKTCAAVDPQEPRGTLSCSNGCQFDTSACCSDWKIRPAAGACGIAQCRAWEKCFMRTCGHKPQYQCVPIISVPASLSAKAMSRSQINVTWLPSKGIYNQRISYFVYRSTDGKNYKMLRVTSDRYFFDRSVRPKTKYFYMVQGFDTMGNRSQVTPAVSATTPAEKVLYSVATNS